MKITEIGLYLVEHPILLVDRVDKGIADFAEEGEVIKIAALNDEEGKVIMLHNHNSYIKPQELPVSRLISEKETDQYQVFQLNKLIGRKVGISEIDVPSLESQLDMIQSEVDELKESLEAFKKDEMRFKYWENCHQFEEMRDALCDILVTTYGFSYLIGVDTNSDMKAVHKSNLSKFCTGHDVKRTLDKAQENGLNVQTVEVDGLTAVKTANYKQVDINGVEWQPNKLYKGILFKKPNFLSSITFIPYLRRNGFIFDEINEGDENGES